MGGVGALPPGPGATSQLPSPHRWAARAARAGWQGLPWAQAAGAAARAGGAGGRGATQACSHPGVACRVHGAVEPDADADSGPLLLDESFMRNTLQQYCVQPLPPPGQPIHFPIKHLNIGEVAAAAAGHALASHPA